MVFCSQSLSCFFLDLASHKLGPFDGKGYFSLCPPCWMVKIMSRKLKWIDFRYYFLFTLIFDVDKSDVKYILWCQIGRLHAGKNLQTNFRKWQFLTMFSTESNHREGRGGGSQKTPNLDYVIHGCSLTLQQLTCRINKSLSWPSLFNSNIVNP